MEMNNIISVEDFKHIYRDGTKVELTGSTQFQVQRGEKVAILGANGTGKSTLLCALTGLIQPKQGEVQVCGLSPVKNFNQVRKKLGVVLQNVEEQIIGPRVCDDISFTLRQFDLTKDQIDERVREIASLLQIDHLLLKIPHYLSGGEQQRVALAGALVHRPEILILDEPMDSLDAQAHKLVEQVLDELNQTEKVTIVMATHDVNWVAEWADHVCVLSRGEIIAYGTPEEIMVDTERLEMAGLKPPVLVSLFNKLRIRGWDLELPVTLEEAEKYLINLDDKK